MKCTITSYVSGSAHNLSLSKRRKLLENHPLTWSTGDIHREVSHSGSRYKNHFQTERSGIYTLLSEQTTQQTRVPQMLDNDPILTFVL